MDPATTVQAGKSLLDQGLLGGLLVLALGAIVALFWLLLKSLGDRIAEAAEQTRALEAAKETSAALKESVDDAARTRKDLIDFTKENTRTLESFQRSNEQSMQMIAKSIEAAVVRKNEQFDDIRRRLDELRGRSR